MATAIKPAMPMKPGTGDESAKRAHEIRSREDAIKRRMAQNNSKSKKDATKKGPGTKYKSEYLKGANEGFMASDYGYDAGAAIPYQIGNKNFSIPVAAKARTPMAGRVIKPTMPINRGATATRPNALLEFLYRGR